MVADMFQIVIVEAVTSLHATRMRNDRSPLHFSTEKMPDRNRDKMPEWSNLRTDVGDTKEERRGQ